MNEWKVSLVRLSGNVTYSTESHRYYIYWDRRRSPSTRSNLLPNSIVQVCVLQSGNGAFLQLSIISSLQLLCRYWILFYV